MFLTIAIPHAIGLNSVVTDFHLVQSRRAHILKLPDADTNVHTYMY